MYNKYIMVKTTKGKKKNVDREWMLAVQTKECEDEPYDFAKIYMVKSKDERDAILYGLLEANKDIKWMFIKKVDD